MEEIGSLVKRAQLSSPEMFRERYVHPVLLQRQRFPIQFMGSHGHGDEDVGDTTAIDVSDGIEVERILQEVGGTASGRSVILLRRPSMTVGRSPDAVIRIPHKSVSTRHAILRGGQEGDGTTVEDEGSSNGTFVDGDRIPAGEPVALSDRDVLGFSTFEFQYFLPETFLSIVERMVERLGGR